MQAPNLGRRGARRALVTYSVKNHDLIRTTVSQSGLARSAIGAGGSSLVIGDSHPVADSLRALDLDAKPLMTRCFAERYAILPEGKIIEQGVRPLDGYRGADTALGARDTTYLPPAPAIAPERAATR